LSGLPLVLLIEDEFLLVADIEEVLAKSGFATESFFSGEEALAEFMESTRSYRALVTDVRLGGNMDGWAVAKGVREKEPDFPVVYVTGATEEEWIAQGVSDSILVRKPFRSAQIVKALSTLLNIDPTK
jgi:DNA-binding response OmpR family regulator